MKVYINGRSISEARLRRKVFTVGVWCHLVIWQDK